MAKEQKAKVLFASSSEVYGDCQKYPQDELNLGYINTTNPRSCYAHGKRIAETLCFDYERTNQMDIKVARIFNTYGPRMLVDDGRVISNFIVQALNKKPITIYGDGTQTRSFCFVDDLIEGLIRLMNSEYKKPVNLGNPEEYQIFEIAQLISKKTNVELKFINQPLPKDDPTKRKPLIDVAKKELNWNPKISLDLGLNKTIQYFKNTLS